MSESNGFRITWVEIVVAVIVLFVLGLLSLPAITIGCVSRSISSTMLSHMKQLHLATQQMALDGTTTDDRNLNWPGTNTFLSWKANLVPSYLRSNDFSRLMALPEDRNAGPMEKLRRWWAGPPPFPMANTNAVLVYQVSEQSEGNVIFLSSANFTNSPTGGALDPEHSLFKDHFFVVFRKGGYGAVLLPKQIGKIDEVGAYAPLLK